MSSFDYGKYHVEAVQAFMLKTARILIAEGLEGPHFDKLPGGERLADIDDQMHKIWGSEDPQDIQRFKDLNDELREVYKCLIQEYIKTAKQPA